MVYGLNVKPEWGYYVGVEALDGDVAKVKAADKTPDGGAAYSSATGGRPVSTEFVPTRMRWEDRNGHGVPDFDNGLILNVSARAKAVIEQFEPGVHQFLPVEYVDIKDRFLENRYFLFICNRIDSLDRERTTMVLRKGTVWRPARDLVRRGEEIPAGIDPDAPSKMVFNLNQIGNAHLWHDKHLDMGGAIISDEIADAFIAANLTGLRLADDKVEAV
jgi:hypothetical protein